VKSIAALVPDGVIPAYATVSLDPRVLAVAAALVAVAGVLSGSLPAVRGSRQEPGAALRSADRSGANDDGGRTFGLQHGLVAVQVALALALMLGAAGMIRSLRAQLRIDPGFEPDGVVAARVFLPRESYPDGAARLRFRDRVLEGVRGRPGVRSVAVGSDAPLRGNTSAAILRVPEARGEEGIRFYRHMVSAGFFETIGARIERGRGFEPTDVDGAPPVVVVSHAFARKLWPDGDALGETIEIPGGRAEVGGVLADTRYRDLTTALMDPGEDPDVWFSFDQLPTSTFDIIVRQSAGATPDIDGIRRAVAAIDPAIPVYQVSTLRDALGRQTATDRLGAVLLGVFGAAALALAAIGLFGVMSFVVSMRRREIAIRIALGSTPRAVLARVLRQGLATVGLGIVAGLAAAAAGGRVIAGILFGVSPLDPLSIGVVLCVLVLAAITATLVPASRASRTDPQGVLRGD
jgi:predicted permease